MKNLLVASALIFSLTSCSLFDSNSDKAIPTSLQQLSSNSTGGVILQDITSSGNMTSSGMIVLESSGRTKTYSNPHYNISFDYPSDFVIETHSGVMSWDLSGSIDQFEDSITLSGSTGIIGLTFPNDTVYIGGAPLYGQKDEVITIGSHMVKKHIEFGSQDVSGPDQAGTWVLRYTFLLDNKEYRFSTASDGIFSQYNIADTLDIVIKDIIKSIKP